MKKGFRFKVLKRFCLRKKCKNSILKHMCGKLTVNITINIRDQAR